MESPTNHPESYESPKESEVLKNINIADTETHLRTLFEGVEGFIELRAFKDNKAVVKFFDSINPTLQWVKENTEKLRESDVYVGVNPRAVKPERGGGKEEHIRTCHFAVVDKDFKKEITVDNLSDEVKIALAEKGFWKSNKVTIVKQGKKVYEIRKPKFSDFILWLYDRIEPLGLKPSLIIDSGWGYHIYIKLNETTPEVWGEIQGYLADLLGGDRLIDPPRIIRLAGTLNNKFALKNTCRILYSSEEPPINADELLKKLKSIVEGIKEARELSHTDFGLNILDVLKKWGYDPEENLKPSGDELVGAHPVHGSTTGRNFWVDPDNNRWNCFRADCAVDGKPSGGGVLQLIAVLEGLIDCKDARKGTLRGELFKKVLRIAKEKYGARIELPKPVDDFNTLMNDDDPESGESDPFDHLVKLSEKLQESSTTADEAWEYEIPPIELNLPEDNFITKFMRMAERRTDAYKEYHFIGAISILSRIAGRRVYVDFLHERVYPNVWAMTLGDSTISRKSTAMKIAKTVVEFVGIRGFFLPHDFSPESLIQILSQKSTGAIWHPEGGKLLATLKKQYAIDLRDFLCILYDGENYYRTLRKEEFEITDPYVTIWLAMTPAVFKKHSTTLDFESGFLARFIYVNPQYEKEWRPFGLATKEDLEAFEEVCEFLKEIHMRVVDSKEDIRIDFDPEAFEFYQEWQRRWEEEVIRTKNQILATLLGRYYLYAVKLAMLFTLGDKEFEPIITLEYIQEACRVVDEYLLPYAVNLIKELEWDEERNLQEKILGTLKRHGGELTRRDLLRYLHKPLREVSEALEALVHSGEIELVKKDGKIVVKLKHKATKKQVNGNNGTNGNSGDYTTVVIRREPPVTELLGIDGKTYLLKANAMVTLPRVNAEPLIRAGIAEEFSGGGDSK
ncbi:DUF3987 domain-containing protein [Geoglobus acetivorans]|uniref:DNA primase, phage related n=1 Tax=Geoglobus acetivorans TaxID=565033 RepID=A0A0A7GDS9_GEOAI|nr:DNA primase, phage related [Geoglobus acetivorans]